VVLIHQADRIINAYGGWEGCRGALEGMRAVARGYGHRGVYFVAVHSGPQPQEYDRGGFDAVTAYTYGFAGLVPSGPERSIPYPALLPRHRECWAEARQRAHRRGLDYIPTAWVGWDDEARAHERSVRTAGNTPAAFRRMLEALPRYVDRQPGLALVEAWNEWGEGSYIEPHRQFGFGYLDALREVFAGGGKHQDLVPEQVGRGPYEVAGLKPGKPEWEFARDREGWTAGMELTDLAVQDGALQATALGNDPILTAPPVRVDTRQRHRLRVRMRTDGGKTGQLFWAGVGSGLSEEASVRWELEPDGEFHEYSLDLEGHPQWRGVVRTLRLDPVDRPAHLAIDYVRLTP
jgi:hypothetical protein